MISLLDPPADATVLPLPGLEADNLLAFVALLGLLRSLQTTRPSWRPRVSWKGPPWIAELHLAEPGSDADVAATADQGCHDLAVRFSQLIESFDEDDRKNVAFERESYRRYVQLAREDNTSASLISALAAEWPEKRAGGIQAAPLVMMFGQGHQNFLERLVAVPRGDLPNRFSKARTQPNMRDPERIAETLFRPWRYQDDADGFRWDPEDDQRYALRYDDPSRAGAAPTMQGPNRLAAVGFTSFIVAPGERQFSATGAIRSDGWCFIWPVWSKPLSLSGIEALLAHPDVLTGALSRLRVFGVTEIFRARRIANGKFMNVTRAQPVSH